MEHTPEIDDELEFLQFTLADILRTKHKQASICTKLTEQQSVGVVEFNAPCLIRIDWMPVFVPTPL